MRLVNVNVQRFRSIEQIEIADCGDFNVFIGKNNTGKSNILSAMQAFFSHINKQSIITSSPADIGRTINFHGKNTTASPIEITLTFLLSLSERDILIQDIIKDAPQMRNALQGIDVSLHLAVTLSIVSRPSLGFISKIVLSSSNGTNEKILINVSIESAHELNNQINSSRTAQKTIEVLMNIQRVIDEDAWRILVMSEGREAKPLRSPSRTTLRSLLSRASLPAEVIEKLLHRVISVPGDVSFEDFVSYARSLARSMQGEGSLTHEEPLSNKIDTFAGEEDTIPNYIFNILKNIASMKVLYLREQRKQIGKDEAAQLLSLKTRRKGPEVLRNIQETVSTLLAVKIDAFESDNASTDGKAVAELDVDDFLVEVNGSGIRESLRLILDVEFEKPNILLVEEPETHLHPALENSMMQYLKSISCDRQVFITTHSTNFMDTADMKNVYLISKQKSTKAQLINFEEAEAQVPRELGIRLSSLFMFDKIVFVEGPSDASIIKKWASIMGINLNQSNVGFITMGGARNILHYASEGTLSFLKKRQVQLYFLIDRDERNDLEISKIKAELGDRATVHILEKREIENYLIVPRVIAKFIQLKRELSSYDNESSNIELSEAEIKATLEECAEELKQITIDKRVVRILCKPIYSSFNWTREQSRNGTILEKIASENRKIAEQLEEIEKNMQKVYEDQNNTINRIWDTQKFDLVPGDELLDKVCRKYNVRFKKVKDGPLLAAQMEKNEIDASVQQVIRQIGS